MPNDKTRLGSGKKMKEDWLKASICLSDIPAESTFTYEGKMYCKVDINIHNKKNAFGKDVSVWLDNYKPEKKDNQSNYSDDDMPI